MLAVLVIVLFQSAVGPVADWMAKQRQSTNEGLRRFQWLDSGAPPASCVGPACGMAAVPLSTARQVGGPGSATVTVRMLWPAPVLIEAGPGRHLVAVGATDGRHPVVARPHDAQADDEDAKDTRPVLLANEVQRDGSSLPITVPAEGFVSAWALDGEHAAQLTPWNRPAHDDPNGYSQLAAIERKSQWQALKMRAIQFQPVPPVVEAMVLRAAVVQPIQVGDAMVLDWQADGALQKSHSQLVPHRNAVGWVTQVQEQGENLRLKVQIPRSSPYGSGHWLWRRLDGMAPGAAPLPSLVQALFFKPGELLGGAPDWSRLERSFFNLPVGEGLRAPAAALDPRCADSAGPARACVWALLQGVAVPVQVNVQPLPGGEVSLVERAVFAGKALRPADWAALPRALRSAYGSPSVPGPSPSRTLLDAKAGTLLQPQPWLRAGLPVSVAKSDPGAKP